MIDYDHPAAPQIGEWIRQQAITPTKNGRCIKFIVRHVSINKKPQGDVEKIDVPEDLGKDENGVDGLISAIVQAAQADANSLRSGVQTYGVFAYFDGPSDFTPRRYFRVAAEEDYDPDASGADSSEPPTAAGLTAQLMRHNEAIMKTAVVQTSHVIQVLQSENNSQRQLLAAMTEKSFQQMALMEEMMDNTSQRRIEERGAAMKHEMMSGAFEHLKLILPVILNKIAGQKIAPETDPSFVQLAALFESMSQEQQQALVTEFLTPTQAALFSEFLGTYEKRKRTLTSKDGKGGPALNLPALFDSRKERVEAEQDPIDARLRQQETKVKSYRDAFKSFVPFKKQIGPSKNQP
jgi:hypothetical protein